MVCCINHYCSNFLFFGYETEPWLWLSCYNYCLSFLYLLRQTDTWSRSGLSIDYKRALLFYRICCDRNIQWRKRQTIQVAKLLFLSGAHPNTGSFAFLFKYLKIVVLSMLIFSLDSLIFAILYFKAAIKIVRSNEEVVSFWQITKSNKKTIYACINYGEAFYPRVIEYGSICIDDNIGKILNKIGNW